MHITVAISHVTLSSVGCRLGGNKHAKARQDMYCVELKGIMGARVCAGIKVGCACCVRHPPSFFTQSGHWGEMHLQCNGVAPNVFEGPRCFLASAHIERVRCEAVHDAHVTAA